MFVNWVPGVNGEGGVGDAQDEHQGPEDGAPLPDLEQHRLFQTSTHDNELFPSENAEENRWKASQHQ
jgi:hypothetical protein